MVKNKMRRKIREKQCKFKALGQLHNVCSEREREREREREGGGREGQTEGEIERRRKGGGGGERENNVRDRERVEIRETYQRSRWIDRNNNRHTLRFRDRIQKGLCCDDYRLDKQKVLALLLLLS